MKLLSVLSLFILPCLVLANDGFGALGAGGIIIGKTNDIAMAKEVLDISYDKIKVDYEFVNESDKDITETIVFPIPPYLVGDPNPYPYYKGNLPNFNVTVNEKTINFQTKVRAVRGYKKETDITQKLKDMSFSDHDIVMADYNIKNVLQNKADILIKNGFLPKDYVYIDNFGIEPLWKNYVTYEWKQTFKAHEKIKISHEYTPLASTGTSGCYYNMFDEYDGHLISSRKGTGQGFCIDSKTLDKLDNLAKNKHNWQGYSCLRGVDISYILRTANTWKDGIRDFHLILRTRTPDETVSTCYPKSIKQTSLTTYEVKLKNFKPKKDLSIYFGNVDKNAPYQPEAKPPIFH
ncbi:MAG: DUF4424 family protein [Sulfuricurvum sp.]|uniref:DUF4424 family protein n=1 Tax=Sulfuricurvum sp. TaxID=2025608 RepID=UPI00262AA4A5|nr:DUF4424 family protein [Sulfuricurvum sp.]MDD2369240.1 DUF4424 family protein [Sulfuricurvum sp.]MDD2949555.1 DUF4424 family protein [Sulfuricurvum sp.]MDD5117321.1 DUF4424 family protein [Sulfuricurvum sp.]